MSVQKVVSQPWQDYELLDAGNGLKFERWGQVFTIRPEVNAYFKPKWPMAVWKQKAHWFFKEKNGQKGVWVAINKGPKSWTISREELSFNLTLTKFKHVGLFPEQSANWDFIKQHSKEGDFLNLFAYTGAASLVAKSAGFNTTHVDSVKQLITWARENMETSQLSDIRWLHEDALKFIQREVKRERLYDGLIMDPPAWGIGAKNQKWKLEDKLPFLMESAQSILKRDGFLILNTYSPQIKLRDLEDLSKRYFKNRRFEVSELWQETQTGKSLFYGNLLRISPLL